MAGLSIDLRNLLCKCGYHKYDMKNMTMMYLGEVGGTVYKYNVQNNCVNCGHHFDEIVYIPMPIWTNKYVAVWSKDYEFVKEEGEKDICNQEKKKENDPMTPDDFTNKMKKIIEDTGGYEESFHGEADDLLCELLISLGYAEGVEIFKHQPKWYS